MSYTKYNNIKKKGLNTPELIKLILQSTTYRLPHCYAPLQQIIIESVGHFQVE
jgi:hypothetical protein